MEVGELVEIFQWMTESESAFAGGDPSTDVKVREELAGVLIYLVRLADVLQIKLSAAVASELASNAEKCRVDQSYGSSEKYQAFAVRQVPR